MCDDPTSSEPYPVLAVYQGLCSVEVYVLTPCLSLVELPMNIVLLYPFFLFSLNTEVFRQITALLLAERSLSRP